MQLVVADLPASRALPMPQTVEFQASVRTLRPSQAANPKPRVGGWELVQLVGEGQLARVYQARPAGAAADQPASYAVKLLRWPWDEDPRGLDTLVREVRAARAVSHAHLVPILASSVRTPPYFVVMPLLRGTTVAAQLEQRKRLPIATSLWIARQVAEGLVALDAAGWMHGDVKPSNIFVAPEGHVTLIDFGFSGRKTEIGSAACRCVVGTLNYMAPEMLTSTLRADIRSDIYSLGATLFEMVSGRLPLSADSAMEIAELHRQGRPDELRTLVPQLPLAAAQLMREMLAKEPLRRPQTPRELVRRLTALEIETFVDRGEMA